MRTEDDLRAALRDRADTTAPPNVTALIDAARHSHGRQPRRKIGVVYASVAVLTIALAVPFVHWVTTQRPVVGGTDNTQSATSLVAPTPQWVAQTLISLIGGGGTVTHVTGHGGANYAGATFTFDDGHGAALVYITADWPVTDDNGRPILIRTGCDDGSSVDSSPGDIHWGTQTLTCATMPDGTQLGVGQPRLAASAGQTYGLALNNVYVLHPDGFELRIGVFNQPTLQTSTSGPIATTRADPPFTVAELTTAALSNRWSASVSAASVHAARTLFPTAAPRTKTR